MHTPTQHTQSAKVDILAMTNWHKKKITSLINNANKNTKTAMHCFFTSTWAILTSKSLSRVFLMFQQQLPFI